MNDQRLLKIANTSMLATLASFILAAILAYGFESELPLILVTILHVSQMFLAGLFKVSYVVRLVALNGLGLPLK